MNIHDFRIDAWQDSEACDYTCTGCAIERHGADVLTECSLDHVVPIYSWDSCGWERDEHCADCGGVVIEAYVPPVDIDED